jgi:hypothetical protein
MHEMCARETCISFRRGGTIKQTTYTYSINRQYDRAQKVLRHLLCISKRGDRIGGVAYDEEREAGVYMAKRSLELLSWSDLPASVLHCKIQLHPTIVSRTRTRSAKAIGPQS